MPDGTTKIWRNRLPADLTQLDRERCRVEYVEMKGWEKDITSCRKWEELPKAARDYVECVEREIGVRVRWIGVGPEREAMIERL